MRPVGSSSSSTTPTLPDPDDLLSERVPAKAIELANHHVDEDCHMDTVLCTIKVILV